MFQLGDEHVSAGEVTYVRLRPRLSISAVTRAVRKVYASWGAKLSRVEERTGHEPAAIFLVPVSDDLVAVITEFSYDDRLAWQLARQLETSTLWQKHDSKYEGGFEVLHGPRFPFPAPGLEVFGPWKEAFRAKFPQRLKRFSDTRRRGALRCSTRCARQHERALDLALQATPDGLLLAEEDAGLDSRALGGPPFYAPLMGEDLDGPWFRVAPVEPTQRVLCCWPCLDCQGLGYAELTWEDGAFRAARALAKRPRSFGSFHVVYDPASRERGLDSARRDRAREQARQRRAHLAAERRAALEREQPLTEAAIDTAIATERREPVVDLLIRGAKHGPPELAAEAVSRLFEYEQRCYDQGKRPGDLNLALLLDFGCGLNSHAHAMVALECLRFGLDASAERSMRAAAPLAPETVAELRRRVQRVPLEKNGPQRLDTLIERYSTWSGPDRPEYRLA